MPRSFQPNRREFIQKLVVRSGLVVAGAAVPRILFAAPDPRAGLLRGLQGIFGDRNDAIDQVGRAWLETAPGKMSVSRLTDQLFARTPGLAEACARPGTDQIRYLLGDQIRKDFACANVVTVNGYYLAQTECLVCGIRVLHRSNIQG